MGETDLISRREAIEAAIEAADKWDGGYNYERELILTEGLQRLPSVQPDRELIEQLRWERDTAIQQLKELGYGLGEKPRTDDTISRQAAIDAHCELCVDRGSCCNDICPDLEVFKLLPSAQQWIPCSERLPEKEKDVLVCYDFKGNRSVLIGALYSDEKFYGYDDEYLTPEGRKYRKAVAWMPLPEPYKGEQE